MPLDPANEDLLEELSARSGGGREAFRHLWDDGKFSCSRCKHTLYNSADKWNGPCVWPSFRRGDNPEALHTRQVFGYNKYKCRVFEVYCGHCKLFVGHQFEDGKEKGDSHADARWRH